MEPPVLPPEIKKRILAVQRAEITEFFLYKKLCRVIKSAHNRDILERIARDELAHHDYWTRFTAASASPSRLKIWLYYLIARVFGITFGLKLMEMGEELAQEAYERISLAIPEARNIARDEARHEKALLSLIDEERLEYTSDIVRGLNVALVELTGTLAGFTLAFPDVRLVLVAGLIAGLVMVLSVASTEYLATKTGEGARSPLKAVFYGSLANIFTLLLLIFPYLVFSNIYFSLGFMVFNAIIIIFLFSFYLSVAREIPLRKRFVEMTLVSLGVAGLAFVIGLMARSLLHIEL